jgi:hypothetical protein
MFVNYYNLQQVISVKGEFDLSIDVENLVQQLRDMDKIGKIYYDPNS